MIQYIFYIIVVSTFAAFSLILLAKWGIIEYVQVHGNTFFSKMFHCDFCLSFWVGLLISIVCAIIMQDISLLCIPFCSTIITRNLL